MSLRSNVDGVTQRRALVEDVSTFNTLLNASGGPALFRATFGQYNYSMMVENSVAALVSVVEAEEKCLGFLVVNDSPTVSVESDVFMATVEALRETAGLSDCKASNTLFLNFFLVDETSRYDSDQVSFDLVRNAFALCPLADYIVWLCPSKVRLGFWMEDHFAHVNVAVPEGGVIPQGVKILYTHRSTFMPKLLVRPARVEDNDDLLPILYNSNSHVVAGQGEFFLADLIQSQDERNKFLVGVHKNIPSGMLALSLDVNVALITKVFDIDAFPDLVIPKVKRPPPPPLFISLLGEIRAVPKHVMRDMVESMNCLFIDAEDVLSKQVSTEEKAGEGEGSGESEEEVETRAARAAMDALKAHILYLLRSSGSGSGSQEATTPTACLVSGFPRNDAEAHEMAQGYMSFDLVLELGDESRGDDDASQQGGGDVEDDFLRHHLESVEALRSFSSAQAEQRCPWYRVALGADSGTKDKDFYAAVFGIVDERAKEVETLMLLDDQEPPKANAFAVTVFCVSDEYESRGEDLLRVAFEEQPSLDYCLYMVANAARPSQLTSPMVQIKTRVGVTFDQTLYLVHRDAFLAHDLLRVERLAAGEMLEAVERFASPLPAGPPKSLLLKACHDSLVQNDMELKDNPPEVCFAVLMGNDVVGVVTASRQALSNDDVTWIRTNYHIDEFVNYDRHRLRAQAQITNVVMNPVFSKWTRYVLREVMRKYFKTILYFFVSGSASPPGEILDEMVPVAPRRRMQTAPGSPSLPLIERPSAGGAGVGSPLFYLTKRQLTEPRSVVPKKVVVVGGGSSSYAVLEKLLFTPHLNLTNIQLVLELPPVAFNVGGGSPAAGDAAAAELPFCSRCSGILSYDDADDPTMTELSAMGVAHRVSIVRGRLTDIDRANKAIVVSDEVISEYDVLVVASTTKDVSTKRFPTTAGTHPAQCAFRGMFGLGDPASDLAALEWVRRQNRDRLPIVVYGDNFETLGAIGSLLEQGVDPSRITAVISVIKIPDLGHPFVVESAMRNLRASGVYLRLGYEIVDVQLTKFGSIESVLLKSIVAEADPDDLASGSGSGSGAGGGAAAAEIPMLSLPCFSLLCAGAKYCDSDVFTAINDCGIVFDGGVVVDQNFNTIDPAIYAVGSFSRFSRVYRDEPLHSARSSRELGLYVGAQLLRMHLDTASPDVVFGGASNAVATQQLPRGRQQLPTFRFPKTMSAPLPNERTLFFSSTLVAASPKDSDTSLLLTGDLSTERICALQLDSLGTLMEIAYIGKSTVEAKNLGRLVGWHESFLNGAVYSYEQGLVEDWIDFFRQSWATALFHDTFPDFANHLRNVLASDTYVYSILDLMRAVSDQTSEDHEINMERRKVLGPRGELISDLTHRTIETATLDFLRKSKLPRFYVPQPGSAVKK